MSRKQGPKAIPYQVETTDEAITPRAGLVLLQEMIDSIGLVDSIDRAMPIPGSGRGLPASTYVISSVLGVPMGRVAPHGSTPAETLSTTCASFVMTRPSELC